MSQIARTPVEVGKIYDEVSAIADAFGDGQFHLGYWYGEEDDASFAEAVRRVTRRVTDSLGLRAGERLLDAGCGPGATAIQVAEETGARVTGISVSDFDIRTANRRADSRGLADRVRFTHGDYMALSYPDHSFDAVMAVESLLTAPDLGRVLAEFHRVLRPGGRVTLCHYTREPGMNAEQVTRFIASISVNRLPTLAEWAQALRGAGFSVEEHIQCGPRVYGMGHKYLRAIEGRRAELVGRFGEAAVARFTQGLQGFYAPRPEDIGYAIISGRKPVA
jgi:cyclopropane fatty-acyl-phospholipid synthase-like methyltransferase